MFNRDVIAGLSDSAVSSVLELDAWINGEDFIGVRELVDEPDVSTTQGASQTALTIIESELIAAITRQNTGAAADLVSQLSNYTQDDRKMTVTTVFLRTIPDAPLDSLGFLIGTGLVDIARADEITDRGCVHEAAIAGRLDVLQLCIEHGMIDMRQG